MTSATRRRPDRIDGITRGMSGFCGIEWPSQTPPAEATKKDPGDAIGVARVV